MHQRSLLPFAVILGLLAGCGPNGSPTASTGGEDPKGQPNPSGGQTGGLKELVKDDIVVGKPTKYQKNLKPLEKGDTVWVYYSGTLKDGTEFDGNMPAKHPDKFPYQFTVGSGSVIRGWEEGVIGMMPGGERKLSVPARLAYGDVGMGQQIKPNTDLYFDIKVIDIVKKGEDDILDKYDEPVGTGKVAGPNSKVTIDCQIRLGGEDGKLYQDTLDPKNKKPETFTIGNSEVHTGFETGIVGMKEGGTRFVRLPPRVGLRVPPSRDVMAPPMVSYCKIILRKVF